MSKPPPLILLHGALGSSAQLEELSNELSTDFSVHTFNFIGHGGRELGNLPFSMNGFVQQLEEFIESQKTGPVHLFGYSMGGFVALQFAALHPEKVNSVFTLATKFDWNPETARKETAMLIPETMMAKVPGFVEQLAKRHEPLPWQELVQKTAEMMTSLGADPASSDLLKQVTSRVRLAVGDRDKTAGVAATLAMYMELKNASLLVLPNTPHMLESVNKQRLALEIRQFMLS